MKLAAMNVIISNNDEYAIASNPLVNENKNNGIDQLKTTIKKPSSTRMTSSFIFLKISAMTNNMTYVINNFQETIISFKICKYSSIATNLKNNNDNGARDKKHPTRNTLKN